MAPLHSRYEVQLGKMLDTSRITGRHLAPYLRNIDVQWDEVNVRDLPAMDFPPTARQRYRLVKDDLLVCEGGEVGRTAVWGGQLDECYYQKAVHRLRRRRPTDHPRFLLYVMWAAASQGVFRAGSSLNTIDHLTAEKLRRHPLPFAPATEQRAIVDFLDRKTEKIDALIAEKRRLIELLEERRIAVISHAVTKGLDPDAPMGDSGVEWLGKVPRHWRLKPAKRVCRLLTGITPPTTEASYYEDGAVPWYGPASIGHSLMVNEAAKMISQSAIDARVARVFPAGSTLLVTIGATIGSSALVTVAGTSNQQITAMSPVVEELDSVRTSGDERHTNGPETACEQGKGQLEAGEVV